MTSRPIWMPLYVRDYLADTRHLTTLQHGAYLLLIMEYWMKGRLPCDDREKASICCLDRRQWWRHKSVLHAMFEGPDWRHPRIDAELQKANELRFKRQVYGSKGARTTNARHPRKPLTVVPWKPKDDPGKS